MAEERGNLLGEFIENFLRNEGMSAYGLSKKMGVSHTTIGDILSGKAKHPTNRILELLSRETRTEFHVLAGLTTPKAIHEYSPEATIIANTFDNLPSTYQQLLMAMAREFESVAFKSSEGGEHDGQGGGGQSVKKRRKVNR
jgi:transcriptional regulator with XRE-family HTH domain